nr:glutathione synthase [Desulfobacterales bacterium]
MIVSFHPCIEGDKDINCAGRLPTEEELEDVKRARAVILPQGCSETLYRLCKARCRHIFPNYDVRFDYPGKTGQAQLFTELEVPHPRTLIIDHPVSFFRDHIRGISRLPFSWPCVLKTDYGGEGEGVFLLCEPTEVEQLFLRLGLSHEKRSGKILLQEFIPTGGRSLRVVVVGNRFYSYWRVQKDRNSFYTSVRHGAVIDHHSDPELQDKAITSARQFCRKTGINLAAFDFLFGENREPVPLFLEINYYFGRRGLGGSFNYYRILEEEVREWCTRVIGSKIHVTL